jgi:hypothetical protein
MCTPLTPDRVSPLRRSFDSITVTHHGALTRYLTLALSKARIRMPLNVLKRLYTIDDLLCRPFGPLRRQGSSVSVVARAPSS